MLALYREAAVSLALVYLLKACGLARNFEEHPPLRSWFQTDGGCLKTFLKQIIGAVNGQPCQLLPNFEGLVAHRPTLWNVWFCQWNLLVQRGCCQRMALNVREMALLLQELWPRVGVEDARNMAEDSFLSLPCSRGAHGRQEPPITEFAMDVYEPGVIDLTDAE